ncbi:hypothetical protein ACFL1E_00885 [Candidatus Omnitrophota bacterium]
MEIKIMKKRDKDFWISKHKERKNIALGFLFKDEHIAFELSYKQWNLFLRLIKLTKSKKNLPKGEDAFQGINLDTGKLMYFSLKVQQLILKTIMKESKGRIPQNKASVWNKRYVKDIKNNFMAKEMHIVKNDVVLTISRKKFRRLCEYCLNQKNFIIISEIY